MLVLTTRILLGQGVSPAEKIKQKQTDRWRA